MAPLNIVDRLDSTVYFDQIIPLFGMKASCPLHEQAPKRKNVSFASVVNTNSIIHINDFSPEEIKMTWYNREELRVIKAEAKIVANSLDKENTCLCLRGLEARTSAGARRKRQNRVEARGAVFFEQEMQDEDGYSDPDAIADAYFYSSERCQAEAQMLALRDQEEAMEVQRSVKLGENDGARDYFVLLPVATGSAAA